jgi:putative aldouronate transport system permease protein
MQTLEEKSFFNFFNYLFLTILSIIAIIPFYLVIVTSFTKESYITLHGYTFFPREFTLTAYKWILGSNSAIFNGYKITIFITAVGLVFSLILVSMISYAASRKHLKYRNIIAMIAWVPTVFYGGLIPFYMVLVKLHFQNNVLGLIVPMLISPFNVFLMLNYFRGLPEAIMESAKIDGASDFRTFIRIVLPMSKPVLATVSLFIILQFWNEWNLTLLLIDTQHRNLYPLQYLLRQILSQVSFAQNQTSQMIGSNELPQESVKMATVVVTIGPIVLVYPYIQRFFVKGITLGAVKG